MYLKQIFNFFVSDFFFFFFFFFFFCSTVSSDVIAISLLGHYSHFLPALKANAIIFDTYFENNR